MQYCATYDPMIWVSRSWDLTRPSQKGLCLFSDPSRDTGVWRSHLVPANEGKWAATNSCPQQIPQTLLGCAGSLTPVTQRSPVRLASADNNSKPLTGVTVLQRPGEAVPSSLPSPGQHQWCAAHAWGLPVLVRDTVGLVEEQNEFTSVLPLVSALISCAPEEPWAKNHTSEEFLLFWINFQIF